MKVKTNVIDVSILLFTIALCFVFVRRRMIIQDMILQEQKAKIETLSKVDVNKYSLEEIEAIVKAIQTPPAPPPRILDNVIDTKIDIDWSKTLLFLPYNTNKEDINKLRELYPNIRIIILDEGEVIGDSLLKRAATSI